MFKEELENRENTEKND
ncbi:hypothetical protein CGSHi22121_06670 [Haemophilus influenzae 22.1-21]|nr:hypothetical protein CGSHi22121_06670 [Haemophilus influenzae 22.1-21]